MRASWGWGQGHFVRVTDSRPAGSGPFTKSAPVTVTDGVPGGPTGDFEEGRHEELTGTFGRTGVGWEKVGVRPDCRDTGLRPRSGPPLPTAPRTQPHRSPH